MDEGEKEKVEKRGRLRRGGSTLKRTWKPWLEKQAVRLPPPEGVGGTGKETFLVCRSHESIGHLVWQSAKRHLFNTFLLLQSAPHLQGMKQGHRPG